MSSLLPGGVLDKDEGVLRRKAGRLLFIGLPAKELDRHWRELLREVRPGGRLAVRQAVEATEVAPVRHRHAEVSDGPPV